MVKKGNGPDLRDRCGQLQVSVQVGNALKMYLLSLLDYSAYGRPGERVVKKGNGPDLRDRLRDRCVCFRYLYRLGMR